MSEPKKSLGQHWLTDEPTLRQIVVAAVLNKDDTVLEIGPGLGSLTKLLVEPAGQVIAVELDEQLAKDLSRHIFPNSKEAPWKLKVVKGNILKFDLNGLPAGYKVVANIPYYLTSYLLQVLTESTNPPIKMVLLLQKEVAERLAAEPGQMSVLAISAQLDYRVELGQVVPARLFKPSPKVDSQVVILDRRPKSLFTNIDRQLFLWLVKAGFSARRKKLRSSLAGGLGITKDQAEELLNKAGIDPNRRAQELNLANWHKLTQVFKH